MACVHIVHIEVYILHFFIAVAKLKSLIKTFIPERCKIEATNNHSESGFKLSCLTSGKEQIDMSQLGVSKVYKNVAGRARGIYMECGFGNVGNRRIRGEIRDK